MKILSVTTFLGLALCAAGFAQACDKGDQRVAKAMGSSVAVYDNNGNYVEDVDAKLVVVNVAIVSCKDQPAHVQIVLTDGRKVWVDRLNVQIASSEASSGGRKCATQPVSRAGDTTMPASSGIDPCGQH